MLVSHQVKVEVGEMDHLELRVTWRNFFLVISLFIAILEQLLLDRKNISLILDIQKNI